MTLDEAKKDLEKFVKLKTTLKPAFVDVLLDTQEVKHGHWVVANDEDDEESYRCSKCGDLEYYTCNYCPNCGAKMDEVEG